VTLQQLVCFCTLADILHYTKAAAALHIAQPTLSYAIAELQRELGVPLFEKRGSKTTLTSFGAAFLPYASRSLEAIEEGQKTLAAMLSLDRETINLGYIYSVSFDFLPKIISEFQKEELNNIVYFNFYQGMKNQIIDKLKTETIDLAFSSEYHEKPIQSYPIFSQELFLVVPDEHPLRNAKEVHLEDFRDDPFIIANRGSGLRVFVDALFRSAGWTPKVVFEAEECNAMAAFVSSRQGVTIMPRIPLLDTYPVAALKLSSPPLFRDISLLWKEGRALPPAAERFRAFVMESELGFDSISL